jgi:hypothetical protein
VSREGRVRQCDARDCVTWADGAVGAALMGFRVQVIDGREYDLCGRCRAVFRSMLLGEGRDPWDKPRPKRGAGE